jgi:hypothetical protein
VDSSLLRNGSGSPATGDDVAYWQGCPPDIRRAMGHAVNVLRDAGLPSDAGFDDLMEWVAEHYRHIGNADPAE